jgi:transcriptional regulator with XRE-family HTH domain
MDRGMSQRELATAADTSQRMVWEIESNAHNATVTMIGRLAEGLGVPPLDLLTPIR